MLSPVRYIDIQIRRYDYLKSLTSNYHTYLNTTLHQQEKIWREESKLSSGGDEEIEQSIFSQEFGSIESVMENEEQQFNLALFLMVYAYYESVKNKMAIIVGSKKDWPQSICEKLNDSLTQSSIEKSQHINSIVSPLRNYVCHNSSGTNGDHISKTRHALDTLLEMGCIEMHVIRNNNNEIDLEKSQLFNIKSQYILCVL